MHKISIAITALILVAVSLPVSLSAQNNNKIEATGNVGIGTTNPPNRLTIESTEPTVPNMIRMEHKGIPNSLILFGTTPSNYQVTTHQSANILESYSDLHLSTVNPGKIFFETGRTGTVAPVRMTLTNTGLGIGTIDPSQRLEIYTAGPSSMQLTNSSDVLGSVGALRFNMAGTEVSAIEAERTVAAGRLSALKFFVRGSSGTVEAMRLTPDGNMGLGNNTPLARLHITGTQGVPSAKFTITGMPEADAFCSIENATGVAGSYIPSIRARSLADGRPFGIFLTGEANDITPSGADVIGGAIVLDGRSKTASRLSNNNVVMINSYGQNLVAFKADGSVGIGATDTKGYKLAVNGSAIFTRVKVKVFTEWPDYVFRGDYQLPSLHEVEKFIQKNQHLPGIPSAAEVEKEGLDLGEMNKKLLQKVEELTLYLIKMEKKVQQMQETIDDLKENNTNK